MSIRYVVKSLRESSDDEEMGVFVDSYLPTLAEILGWATEGTDEEKEYYSQFGFGQLEVFSECPIVKSRMDRLELLFNEKYDFRQINRETMEQWQISLQTRFDGLVCSMEHMYTLQNIYQNEIDQNLRKRDTETTTHGGEDAAASSGTQTYTDTPDSVINAGSDYADSVQKTSGTTKTTHGHTITTERSDLSDLQSKMDHSMDAYRDIDRFFIDQFENNFLNVFY